jgi:hypothetical protein
MCDVFYGEDAVSPTHLKDVLVGVKELWGEWFCEVMLEMEEMVRPYPKVQQLFERHQNNYFYMFQIKKTVYCLFT